MGNGDCFFFTHTGWNRKIFFTWIPGSFGLLEYNTDKILKYCEKAGYLPIKRVFQEKVWKFSGGNFPATFISYSVAVCIFLWMSKKAIRGPLILSNAQIWIFDTESEGGIVRRGLTAWCSSRSPDSPLLLPRSTTVQRSLYSPPDPQVDPLLLPPDIQAPRFTLHMLSSKSFSNLLLKVVLAMSWIKA